MNKKYILIADLILVFGSLISIFVLVGYAQPLVTAPLLGNSSEQSLIFAFDSADYVLIDDNFQFDSPDTFFADGESFVLKSGKYYVKSVYGLSSEVREIKTEVEITLELMKLEDGSLGVFNIGKSDLNVETYETGSLINNSLVYAGGE